MRKILPALRREPGFQTWVAERRAEGLLDWQILALILNAVFNARMSKSIQANDVAAHRAFISSEETDATLPYTLEELLAADMKMVKRVSLAAVASTWKLDFRSTTPDFDALKRLLDA
ncbi:hypothetical protein EH244_32140 [Variovorax beijingensis]|uniref:Uncharacterized protein n=1 Tax=Variovorax beijingensis TaxID=2496117 RepID=A0A3P3DXZ6_9BURK|nr:hypothetical protein [Variovorax beijingensis]RRH79001.1 hypothetical protein EH244_32140 [Variovorax beijingensis]